MSIFVISGGAGFLGAALAKRLGRAGHEVRVLDDFSSPEAEPRAAALSGVPTVFLCRGDVRDEAVCRSLCEGAEYVVHFASPPADEGDAARCLDTVAGGALNLIQAARAAGTVRRLVSASSSAVYGENSGFTRHEASLPDPATPLACALLSAEHFCRSAFRQSGLQTVCLRFFDVYGPGMNWQDIENAETNSVAAFVRAAVTGAPAAVAGGHAATTDWIYIDDAVDATVRAVLAQRGVSGKVFNVGSGRALPSSAIREILEQIMGQPLPVVPADAPSGGGQRGGRADMAAAAGLLQFTVAVGLEQGLAQTLHWAKEQPDSWNFDCVRMAA